MAVTCGIYCITNNVNGKQYVGRSVDIQNRFRLHLSEARSEDKKHSLFHRALREHGPENFQLTILEECAKEQLADREQYYVKKLSTLAPGGYNELERYLYEVGWSQPDSVKAKISQTMQGPSNKRRGYKMTESEKSHLSKQAIGNTYNTRKVLIVRYSTNEIIGRYAGLTQAAEALGLVRETLWDRLNRKRYVDDVFYVYEDLFTPEYRDALKLLKKHKKKCND